MAMKASPNDQRRLLELQLIDSSIARAQRAIANPPQAAEIDSLSDRLVELDRAVLDRLGSADDITAVIKRLEDDAGVVEQRRARDQQRLDGGADAKTAQALQQELATLGRRRDELDEQQLESMEQLEAAHQELADARAAADEVRSRRDALVSQRDAEAEVARTELDGIDAERKAVAATLPGDLLALYEKIRSRYGFGVSELRGNLSVAAGVELTAAELAEVGRASDDDVVQCPTSSAILVRPAGGIAL